MKPDPIITRDVLDLYYSKEITEAEMRKRLRNNHLTEPHIEAILREAEEDRVED